MKLFDFQCNACGRAFEELVQDVSEARCPSCASQDVAKQMSAFAVTGGRADPAPRQGGGCGGGFCGGGGCGLN